MNTFFTPPSHSTARLIEASVCLLQLFCFLSSRFPPWSRRTRSPAASTRSCTCTCARARKMAYICRTGLVAAGRPPSRGGFCGVGGERVDILASVAFNDCANEHVMKCSSARHRTFSLLSLTRLP